MSRSWSDEVAKRLDSMVALRRDFHRHPELSFQETRTSEIIAERLTKAGLEVRTGIAKTGVVGVLRGDKPGKTIAWRADIDALPLTEILAGAVHVGHARASCTRADTTATRRSRSPPRRSSPRGARSCRAPRSSSSSPRKSC